MKQQFIPWVAVAMTAILLPDVHAQPARPKAASNQDPTAKSKVSTNTPVAAVTNKVTVLTNALPKIAQIPELQYTNGIGMELVKTPGGFWAGVYEVTQKEYHEIMGANPSAFPGARRPVDNV